MAIDYSGKKLVLESKDVEPGKVKWQSPSNIALVKYWGKYGNQIPRNPSISFTLSDAYTETEINYKAKERKDEHIDLSFTFEGQENEAFAARIKNYFQELLPIFPFLRQISMDITSSNTFPHSSGIASSASAMSALALCLCTLEHNFFGTLPSDEEFERKASYVARLGSGSACRSIFAKAALWGDVYALEDASDEYAISLEKMIHPIFMDYRDSILLVNKGVKSVSSSAGHKLMDSNPYAQTRYSIADRNIEQLLRVLKKGDLEHFIDIVEAEALQLHALMMMSYPSYILMEPATLSIIREIKRYRKESGIPLCFTLDAGPNVHLLYPAKYIEAAELFIEEHLLMYCEGQRIIKDKVGEGPLEI